MVSEARTTPSLPQNGLRAVLRVLGIHPAISRETDQPVLLVGSRRDCDLYVNNADVSKVHCAIVNTGDALMVADLSSRLGTYVNDQKVTVTSLKPGDRLSVANVSIQIEWLAVPANIYTKPEKFVLPHPLRLAGDGHEYSIDAVPAVIGRRGSSAVPLDTPDVSLAHALIFTIAGKPVIADLESRSGTYVQHNRVRLAWLCNQDEVKVGGIPLTVNWTGPVGTEPSMSTAGPMLGPGGSGVMMQGQPMNVPMGMTFAAQAMPAVPIVATLQNVNDAQLESTIQELRDYLDRVELQLRGRTAKLDEREKAVEQLTKSLEAMRVHFESQSIELQTKLAAVERRERELSAGEETINEARNRLSQFQAALLETKSKLTPGARVVS